MQMHRREAYNEYKHIWHQIFSSSKYSIGYKIPTFCGFSVEKCFNDKNVCNRHRCQTEND